MSSFKHLRLGLKPVYYSPWVYWSVEVNQSWLGDPSDHLQIRFQPDKSGLITHIGINLGNYFGGVNTRDMIASLQGLNSSGRANGSIKAHADFNPNTLSGDGENFEWLELDAAYSCQRGEMLALVISSAEDGDVNNMSAYKCEIFSVNSSFPTFAGRQPVFGYKFDTGEAFGLPLTETYFYDSERYFNYPEQRGLRFVLDEGWGDVFRVAGVRWQGLSSGSSGADYSYHLCLYQGTKVLQNVNMYADQGVNVYPFSVNEVYFDEETLADLAFGTEYIISLEPQDATTGMCLDSMSVLSSADMTALPGGQAFHWAQRTSSDSDWVTDSARRPAIDLIIDYWGRPAAPQVGMHVKVIPKYNSSLFIEHADDMIHDVQADELVEGEAHEVARTVIGNAVKAYGGFLTVEVFKDPDTEFSIETRLYAEQLIEDLKIVGWDSMAAGLYHLVFRFRTAWESDYYVDYDQWMRIVN